MDENPYLAPQGSPDGTATTQPGVRPTTATVFGVLNIAFGAMGILGAIATFAILAATASGALPEPQLPEAFKSPLIESTQLISNIVNTVLSILMIAAGVGLLKVRPWGRSLSIWIAIGSILVIILAIGIQLSILAPALSSLDQLDTNSPEDMGVVGGFVGGVVGGCVGLIYPIATLVFMNRRKFKEAYAAAQA